MRIDEYSASPEDAKKGVLGSALPAETYSLLFILLLLFSIFIILLYLFTYFYSLILTNIFFYRLCYSLSSEIIIHSFLLTSFTCPLTPIGISEEALLQ